MIKRWFDNGLEGYFFSFMFNPIPGTQEAKWNAMKKEIELVHRKLTRHIVRNPNNPLRRALHPRCIACSDYRVWKHKKIAALALRALNDGLHGHAIVVVPPPWSAAFAKIGMPQSRLREPLNEHFERYRARYTNKVLARIHVEPIVRKTMADYLLKSVKHGTVSRDDILVL